MKKVIIALAAAVVGGYAGYKYKESILIGCPNKFLIAALFLETGQFRSVKVNRGAYLIILYNHR